MHARKSDLARRVLHTQETCSCVALACGLASVRNMSSCVAQVQWVLACKTLLRYRTRRVLARVRSLLLASNKQALACFPLHEMHEFKAVQLALSRDKSGTQYDCTLALCRQRNSAKTLDFAGFRKVLVVRAEKTASRTDVQLFGSQEDRCHDNVK